MPKKHFKRERWMYEGNHPNGQDTIILDEIPELAAFCGVHQNEVYEAIHWGPLHEKGASAKIGKHTVKVTKVKWGKSNGFGRDHSVTFTIVD